MKVVFYMNCVSAHQLPLAKEVSELVGPENFCYVDAGERSESAQRVETKGLKFKVQRVEDAVAETATVRDESAREWLETADVMLTGMRDLELFERRAKKGLRTYYTSERWFKPIHIAGRMERLSGLRCLKELVDMSGQLRMLVPSYRRMVKRFVRWTNADSDARVLAIGPWARRDFLRMGVVEEKIIPWGYFVSPSIFRTSRTSRTSRTFSLLWCGRMIPLKHVADIVRAVSKVKNLGSFEELRLTLVGDGPEKHRLMALAAIKQSNNQAVNQSIAFLPSQSPDKIRELMRQHDLFVLASNGYEGWGAVVSEALEEGMSVLGTFEAGASATLLPKERLFHCGDWKTLARLIEKEARGELPPCRIGEWTAATAARRLLMIAGKRGAEVG